MTLWMSRVKPSEDRSRRQVTQVDLLQKRQEVALGFRDVTLAYDDDANGTKGVSNVTLAYDDDAIGALDFRNVTLAHDDHTKETMGF